MEVIEFKTDEIRLRDLLKATDSLASRGLAKHIIREAGVLINVDPCYIAGKKLHPGDEIVFDGVKIIIK